MVSKSSTAYNSVSGATNLTLFELETLEFILPMSIEYPGLESWFINKVVPGFRSGSRLITRTERRDQIAAVGIAKLESGEAKVCTVRVAAPFVGRGFGVKIFDELMQWLKTDRPLLTVSEQKLLMFETLFKHYGFRLTSVCNGIYLPGKAEYVFNELRSPWGQSLQI